MIEAMLRRGRFRADAETTGRGFQMGISDGAFAGKLLIRPLEITLGKCIENLEPICRGDDPSDTANRLVRSPLR